MTAGTGGRHRALLAPYSLPYCGLAWRCCRTTQDTACMALMLLEYGGVVLFNMPESLHSEALARVAAAALLDDRPGAAAELGLGLPREPPQRPGGGRAELASWRQAVADKLSLHKEGE